MNYLFFLWRKKRYLFSNRKSNNHENISSFQANRVMEFVPVEKQNYLNAHILFYILFKLFTQVEKNIKVSKNLEKEGSWSKHLIVCPLSTIADVPERAGNHTPGLYTLGWPIIKRNKTVGPLAPALLPSLEENAQVIVRSIYRS